MKRCLILLFIFIILFSSLNGRHGQNGGIVLIGGGYCKEAIAWMLNKTQNKSILVLSADDVRMYWLYELEDIAIIDFLSVPSREAANSDLVIDRILNAESILISGGLQYDYIRLWKGTRLARALSIMSKTIPVAGVSAGLAIMGEYYYSGEKDTTTSDEALFDPYNVFMESIGNNFLNLPFMKGIITDSHYGDRNRYGRHLAFMARILNDCKLFNIKGIGIDENTAVCINMQGTATIVGKGKCYLIESISLPDICAPGKRLVWRDAAKVHILSRGNFFNINNWKFKDNHKWKVEEGKLIAG